MDSKVRVMLLAASNAGDGVYTKGKKQLLDVFDAATVEFVTSEPDMLVFLSGKSALEASVEVSKNTRKHYLLMPTGDGKAYASASELKAWMNAKGIGSTLVDYESPEAKQLVGYLYDCKKAFSRIAERRIYIPNELMVNEISSSIKPSVLEARFGMQLGYRAATAADMGEGEGCAGDACSLFGMLLLYELCGVQPAIVELSKLGAAGIGFEQCGAAALLASYLAIDSAGVPSSAYSADELTIFRLNGALTEAFVAVARLKRKTDDWTKLELHPTEATLRYFTEAPLGNHHLALPGNHADKLKLACHLKKIAIQ